MATAVYVPQGFTTDSQGNLVLSGANGGYKFASGSAINSPADGVITLQKSDGTAARLTLGQNTAGGGVGIARSGSNVVLVNGDGSAVVGLSATSLMSNANATTAGANGAALATASTGPGLYVGAGTPTLSAPNGSIFLNYAASAVSTRLWVNTSGASTSGTTWTAIAV